MKKNLKLFSLLTVSALISISACTNTSSTTAADGTTVSNPAGTFINNVGTNLAELFVPTADLSITSITSTDIQKGVSIIQTFQATPTVGGSRAIYKFNEPTVTIENRVGLPRVIFKQMITQFTIAGQQLPPKNVPFTFTVPTGGRFSGTIPVLASSDDLLRIAFPNNTVTVNTSGTAQATLLGVDDNNHLVSLNFTTPIRFESDVTGLVIPSASPSPSADNFRDNFF